MRLANWRWAILPTVVLASGVAAGYLIAREASAPGELKWLVYTWLIPIGLVGLLFTLAGAIGRSHAEVASPTGQTQALATGIALAAGAVIGIVMTPVLGLTYPPAVVLAAAGPSTLTLPAAQDFDGSPSSVAACRSVAGATAMAAVDVQTAGRLRGEVLNAEVRRDPAGTGIDTITIELNRADGPVILWDGPVAIATVDPDGRAGTATFSDLAGANAADKGLPRASAGPGDGWPSTLAGTLTWTCGAWTPR
jgi:hypothetical protein